MAKISVTSLSRGKSHLIVRDVHCAAACGETDVEDASEFSVILPRRGVFLRGEGSGEPVVANPAAALFSNPGDRYVFAHPIAGGDACTWITLPPRFAEQLTAPWAGRFPTATVSIAASDQLKHYLLRSRIRAADGDDLETEEAAADLVAGLLNGHDQLMLAGVDARRLSRRVAEYLSVHYAADAGLEAIARAVGYTPHHLSRTYHRVTGRTISGHRFALRCHAALARLADGADDLNGVALASGFYDHAHMARCLKRSFGHPPSGLRSLLSPG